MAGFVSILGVFFKCVCGIVYLLGGGFKHVLFFPLPGKIYNFFHVLLLCLNSQRVCMCVCIYTNNTYHMYIYTEMLFLSGCSDHDIGPSEATVWVLLVGHHPPPAHVFQDFSSQHPLYLCLEVWNLTKNQHTVRTEKGHLLTKVGRSRQKYHGFPPKPTLHLNQSMFCPVFRTWWTSYIGSVAWMVA